MANLSEDAMFKALLKNKPPQNAQTAQKTQVAAKKETLQTVPAAQKINAPIREKALENPPPAAPVDTYKNENPGTQSQDIKPAQNDIILESIKNLTASVNTMQGLMKTVIVPVLALILIVGVGIIILIKTKL